MFHSDFIYFCVELESDTPVDMWSVGCLAAELYTGTALFPFHHDQHIEQMRAIQEVLNHRLVMSEIKSATKSVHPLPPKSLPLQVCVICDSPSYHLCDGDFFILYRMLFMMVNYWISFVIV